MKHKILPGLVLILSTATFAQPKQQDSAELEKRNGFKNIKLGQHIDSVKGTEMKKEFQEKNEFPAKLYVVKNDFLGSIGEVKIKSIELKTYKDLVYEIEVITEKDARLMQGMEKALGESIYNIQTDAYHWRAPSLSLTFFGHRNWNKLLYKSYPVIKMMFADRGKKIETIAEDF
jgi:hypothetical protein